MPPISLNAAGSRRTVYLGDEKETNVDQPTSSNGDHPPAAPATFLMYNKISTTIGGKESPTPTTNGSVNGNDNQKNKGDKKKSRESAIW